MQAIAKPRVQSVDIVRGIVMIIMALDHTRDFLHIHAMDGNPLDLTTTTPLLFFTRWITHFCAPTFAFLSGVSAWLASRKKTKKELSIFLLKRGLWLIIAEVVIMTFGFTFDPLYHVILLNVLWSLGVSMVLLGLMVNLPMPVIVTVGLIICFGHNIFDYVAIKDDNPGGWLLRFFVNPAALIISIGQGRIVFVGYAAVPWAGLMMLGYAFGQVFNTEKITAPQRKKILVVAGLAVCALFVVLRMVNKYGDPVPALPQKTPLLSFLSFINTTKYPPSLDFLCMTVGPTLLLLAFFDQVQNKFTAFVSVYGKVPFFYFIVHFYLVHVLVVVAFFASGHGVHDIVDKNSLFYFRPVKFGYELPVVYAIWIFVVLALYKPCKWFAGYKATHKQWWLSYL